MKALSREQVRMVDRLAIEQYGLTGLVLMENAGRGVADILSARLAVVSTAKTNNKKTCEGKMPSLRADETSATLAGRRVAIVAGAGNNGGDGFVVARHLAMRGASVVTFLVSPVQKIAGDAAANLQVLRNLRHDIRTVSPDELRGLAAALKDFDLVVDAIGGTGISGPLRGELAVAVEQVNAAGRPIVAIDIPTGLDCDTGQPLGATIRANLTVTFVARKIGFDAPSASQYTGIVVVADIGVPAQWMLDATKQRQ